MSGDLHDKGMQIIAGYLRSQFAQDKPLSLAASICFEQSYSGVDGDSASSTEVYALLSALSGIPTRQDIQAVTWLGESAGSNSTDRRSKRKGGGLLRRVPRARINRDAGRPDPGGKRGRSHAARRFDCVGRERNVSRPSRGAYRRGHRDSHRHRSGAPAAYSGHTAVPISAAAIPCLDAWTKAGCSRYGGKRSPSLNSGNGAAARNPRREFRR